MTTQLIWTVRDAGNNLLATRDTLGEATVAATEIERDHDRECRVQQENLPCSVALASDVYSRS